MNILLRFFSSRWSNESYTPPEHRIDITINESFETSRPEIKSGKVPWVNIILFLATAISTLISGTLLEGEDPLADIRNLRLGIPFAFTLMAILTFHEFGHYILARRHGLKVTFPYFIPFPFSPVGTFGAIIKIKSPIMNKRALLDIGAAGPIAGFLVALPALYFGLQASEAKISPAGDAWSLGSSLMMWILQYSVFGNLPTGYDVYLNSVAFAGWFGLLVTAFNLLPLGQLDGGHIMYALTGQRQFAIARILFGILLLLGFWWKGWWIWASLTYLMRLKHPPTIDEYSPLDKKRKIIGILCLLIFVLCFIPIPFKIM